MRFKYERYRRQPGRRQRSTPANPRLWYGNTWAYVQRMHIEYHLKRLNLGVTTAFYYLLLA
jgi:hypothetical protein